MRWVLKYAIAAWGAHAKSNFGRSVRELITGSMKTTPIRELEKITFSESLENK